MKSINIYFLIVIIIILLYYIYEWVQGSTDEEDADTLEKTVDKIIKKKKVKNVRTTIEACKNGLLQGCLITFATTANVPAAMTAGVASGIVNGIVHHLKND